MCRKYCPCKWDATPLFAAFDMIVEEEFDRDYLESLERIAIATIAALYKHKGETDK